MNSKVQWASAQAMTVNMHILLTCFYASHSLNKNIFPCPIKSCTWWDILCNKCFLGGAGGQGGRRYKFPTPCLLDLTTSSFSVLCNVLSFFPYFSPPPPTPYHLVNPISHSLFSDLPFTSHLLLFLPGSPQVHLDIHVPWPSFSRWMKSLLSTCNLSCSILTLLLWPVNIFEKNASSIKHIWVNKHVTTKCLLHGLTR